MRCCLIILLTVISWQNVKASPQLPEYLIIGQDTFAIYFLPLNRLDNVTLQTFTENLQNDDSFPDETVNLWRGYQGYWQLLDNKLYLVGLKGNAHTDNILKKTFQHKYKRGKVLAYWFSSYLAVGKGKMLQWDGVFSRTSSVADSLLILQMPMFPAGFITGLK